MNIALVSCISCMGNFKIKKFEEFKGVDFIVHCKFCMKHVIKFMKKLLSGHTGPKKNCHFYTAGSPAPKITRAFYKGGSFLV